MAEGAGAVSEETPEAIGAAPPIRLHDLLAARRERDEARKERDDLARRITEVAPMLGELKRLGGQLEGQRAALEAELRELTGTHETLLEEILRNADEDINGGDEAPEYLAEAYVRLLERERDQARARKAALRDMTRGQAARKAWDDWWAGASGRGRGKPGYDEKAETDAGWEVSADAGIEASGLRAQLDEARRELAEVRELAHNVHDVRRIDALTAEREKLSGACQLLARVVSDQGRAMYAAWIDAERGDHKAAKETITRQVEQVLELHTWNGTETGAQWRERTDGEENEDGGTAPVLADPETMTAVAEGEAELRGEARDDA